MPSYSSIIRTLRIAIPALGVLLFVLFCLWPTITRIRLPHVDKAIIKGERTELVNPRYEGKDASGKPYLLTADRAIQVRSDPDHVTLIAPTAALENNNTPGDKVIAENGIFQSKTQQLSLSNNVTLVTPQGDTFITQTAEVNLHSKIVTGTVPITGDGPRMTLSAQGFEYHHTDGLLMLTGPAKLVLHETHEKTPPSPAPAAATGARAN